MIDVDGQVSRIFRKVKPAERDEKVRAALAEYEAVCLGQGLWG